MSLTQGPPGLVIRGVHLAASLVVVFDVVYTAAACVILITNLCTERGSVGNYIEEDILKLQLSIIIYMWLGICP